MAFNDHQIEHIAGLLHAALVSARTEFTTGKYIVWTARVPSASVVIVPGAVRALSVSGTVATVTVVLGVTTYAQIAADWAASAAASALAYIGGDAGTVLATYAGETLAIGTKVGVLVRAPLALTAPEGQFPVLCVYRRQDDTAGRGTAREVVTMQIAVEYYLGRESDDREEDAWSDLPAIASQLRQVVQQKRLVTYPAGADAGKTLAVLAGIEEIHLAPVKYAPALPDGSVNGAYPAFQMEIVAKYQDQSWTGRRALTSVHLEHNEPVAHEVPATSQGQGISSRYTP